MDIHVWEHLGLVLSLVGGLSACNLLLILKSNTTIAKMIDLKRILGRDGL
jgi:hypothetical protein